MRTSSTRIVWPVLAGLMLVVGCSSSNGGGAMSGVSPDQARQMNGERSQFETTEDPPITADTHFAAGQVAENNLDYASAVKQYKKALELKADHRGAMYRTGLCLSLTKKWGEAFPVWKKYVEATGGDAVAFSNLGFCYELSGRTDEAEVHYKKGIERDAKNVPCRTNYGLMLARLNRTAEATLQLQAVLTEAEVHYNIASVYEQVGRKQAAKAEYKKALELDPTFEEAQSRLAALE
ncbi:MAG TPA: tetratricopeptide repeat protein [Tepidisphaeraceae bacterium]|nr:tetratricopeptide repeat protein [Tepidisphaeraceae bacterium]